MTLRLTRKTEPEGGHARAAQGRPEPRHAAVEAVAGQIRKMFERNIASLRRLLAEISR